MEHLVILLVNDGTLSDTITVLLLVLLLILLVSDGRLEHTH